MKTLPSLHHRLTTTTTTTVAAVSPPPSPPPTTTLTPPPPVNPSHLLHVSTVLYQQQHSPKSRLHTSFSHFDFHLNHESFLQICNKHPYSFETHLQISHLFPNPTLQSHSNHSKQDA
ncbi:hypothetical protein Hanom_Chr17g01524551 [Helianthus anomalus]